MFEFLFQMEYSFLSRFYFFLNNKQTFITHLIALTQQISDEHTGKNQSPKTVSGTVPLNSKIAKNLIGEK